MWSIHILIVILILACLVVLVGVLAIIMHWGAQVAYPLIVGGFVTELVCAVLLVRALWKRRNG